MRLLALDCSSWCRGAALLDRDPAGLPRLVAEIGAPGEREARTEGLLGWVEKLLDQAGWSKSDLELFVATRGPGSFTGIRVGLGTIRGLSLATGRPCTGVTTLEAMVEAFGPAEAERVPLLSAGRGEVYGARYDARSSPPVELEAPWVGVVEGALEGNGRGRLLLPDPRLAAALDELGKATPGLRVKRLPNGIAAAAGRLALLRDLPSADEPLSPLYVRRPDAMYKSQER